MRKMRIHSRGSPIPSIVDCNVKHGCYNVPLPLAYRVHDISGLAVVMGQIWPLACVIATAFESYIFLHEPQAEPQP